MKHALGLALGLTASAACAPSTRAPGSCDGPCPAAKKIDHLVIVVQENHTFDNYFAKYCTAAPGSSPTCTQGAACCEAGPGSDPSGAAPIALDDAANAAYDPNHTQGCELSEIDGGMMDRYVTGVTGCSDPRNFAYARLAGCSRTGTSRPVRDRRSVLPADRRAELVERHVPGARAVRVPRRHVRAAGDRQQVRAPAPSRAVHRTRRSRTC